MITALLFCIWGYRSSVCRIGLLIQPFRRKTVVQFIEQRKARGKKRDECRQRAQKRNPPQPRVQNAEDHVDYACRGGNCQNDRDDEPFVADFFMQARRCVRRNLTRLRTAVHNVQPLARNLVKDAQRKAYRRKRQKDFQCRQNPHAKVKAKRPRRIHRRACVIIKVKIRRRPRGSWRG